MLQVIAPTPSAVSYMEKPNEELCVVVQESASGTGPPKRACTDGPTPVPSAKVSSELREQIVRLYKLQMPEDLYHFWDFCQGLSPDDPRGKFLFFLM